MHARRLPRHAMTLDDVDQRVIISGVTWAQYEAVLAMRGESSSVRIAFLEGELELMSPLRSHEKIKTMLARLIEMYGYATGIEIIGAGSWTLKKRRKARGAEADECYNIGKEHPTRPDL